MSAAQELVTHVTVPGLIPGTNFFYGEWKELYPDVAAIIRDTGGIGPEPALGEGLAPGRSIRLQFPSVQVVCRGVRDDFDTPMANATAIYNAFVAIVNQLVGTVFYQSIDPMQEPFLLKADETFRMYIAFNARIMKGAS